MLNFARKLSKGLLYFRIDLYLHDNWICFREIYFHPERGNFPIILSPLDKIFPKLTVAICDKLEFLCRSIVRWSGTGFIVKCQKL